MASESLPHKPPHAHALERVAAALEAAADALRILAERDPDSAPPAETDPLLTVVEAAAHLRRSSAHVRAQCRSGAIRAMRDGQGWRIRRSELSRYERRRTR
jgi:excisionase family DNA binding protein